LLKNWKISH